MKRGRNTAIVLVALTILSSIWLVVVGNDLWFPEKASTVAADVDFVFNFITWVSIFFFALIMALMFWYCYQYQRVDNSKAKSQVTHNTPLELAWTILPLIIVIFMFYVGLEGYLDMRQAPAEAYEVRVTGQRWSWTFDHPNGASEAGELHVPVGVPVKLLMQSQDVLHAVFIPAFRVKMDAVPGRITHLWFEATKEGEYDLYCAEYCGKDHSQMTARVYVMPQDDFKAKVDEIAREYEQLPDWELPVYAMNKLYPRCASCHALEDKTGTGPSWRETFRLLGKNRVFTDGSEALVDENYIRESILEPQKKIVEGFTGAMPTFKGQLRERQIYALQLMIRYLDRFDDEGNLITPITEDDFYPSGKEDKQAEGEARSESTGGQETS